MHHFHFTKLSSTYHACCRKAVAFYFWKRDVSNRVSLDGLVNKPGSLSFLSDKWLLVNDHVILASISRFFMLLMSI